MILSQVPLPRLRRVALLLTGAAMLASATHSIAQSITAPLTVTTFAGQVGTPQAANGTGTAAGFWAPTGLVVDASGNVIVADAGNNLFRRITPAGVVTTIAGTAIDPASHPFNVGSADGTGANASFHMGDPAGTAWDPNTSVLTGANTLALDANGTVWFADTFNNTLRKMTSAAAVSTVSNVFAVPSGVAVDSSGNVYVTDSANDVIRMITPAGAVSIYAGSTRAFGSTDGTGSAARFTNPVGIAADAGGNLYVADSGNQIIRKITPGAVVTTLAGAAGISGSADGSARSARFNGPTALAVDKNGNVYVADTGNNTIRKITPSGTVTTVAGLAGNAGTADGTGTAARFNQPSGLAIDAAGTTLYIADTSNNTIRRATMAASSSTLQVTGVPPTTVQVLQSANVTLKIAATGTPAPSYQWYKDGSAISGATGATLTLNSVTSANAGSYFVTVTSDILTYTSALIDVRVYAQSTTGVPTLNIVTQPADRSVAAGQSTTFTVEASSAQPITYQWYKNGAIITGATNSTYTIASVDANSAAAYTVTLSDGTTTVTTSSANLTVSNISNVAPTISTQPASQSVVVGGNVTFTVAATGTPSPTFQWQKNGVAIANSSTISGATTNTLTITGVTAADAGNYSVSVANVAATVASNTATLTVSTTQPTGPNAWLTNLSVRTNMTPGQDPLIVGLTVSGGSKEILVRGAGPAMAGFVANTMADPKLDLYVAGGTSPILSNDDWASTLSTKFDTVGAFSFPAGSKDAAFSQTLSGGYTVLAPVTGTGGVILVEAYDLNPTSNAIRLTNISARNFVGTGDNVLIEGFVIRGTGTKKLLIRAVGPTLANVLPNALQDPKFEVYNGTTIIDSNDNWDSSLTTTFDQVGAFHLTAAKDAAKIVELQATPTGTNYTVLVKGADGGTGQAIVEIYELP